MSRTVFLFQMSHSVPRRQNKQDSRSALWRAETIWTAESCRERVRSLKPKTAILQSRELRHSVHRLFAESSVHYGPVDAKCGQQRAHRGPAPKQRNEIKRRKDEGIGQKEAPDDVSGSKFLSPFPFSERKPTQKTIIWSSKCISMKPSAKSLTHILKKAIASFKTREETKLVPPIWADWGEAPFFEYFRRQNWTAPNLYGKNGIKDDCVF